MEHVAVHEEEHEPETAEHATVETHKPTEHVEETHEVEATEHVFIPSIQQAAEEIHKAMEEEGVEMAEANHEAEAVQPTEEPAVHQVEEIHTTEHQPAMHQE